MHELPPLVHPDRGSIIDLHHAILPRTSRLRPSTDRLLARAVESGPTFVLCPAHMVLHAAAHLFHDGEIGGAIRDLVDLDALFRHFAAEADFWNGLLAEAVELELERPAFYAVRYADRLLGTPVPREVEERLRAWAPTAPVLWLMDGLVERTLAGQLSAGARASVLMLQARSQWLKMPPWLLARHLAHKAAVLRG